MPIFRDLKTKLTDAELKSAARAMAFEEQTHREIEEEAKSSAKGFKTRLDASEKVIADLCEKIRSETETRAVEVYTKPDDRRFVVETRRVDTGELIDTRAMNANERHAAISPTLPGLPVDPPTPVPGAQVINDKGLTYDGVIDGYHQFTAPPPEMKTAPGDIQVTGGAGGLPEGSAALPDSDQFEDGPFGDDNPFDDEGAEPTPEEIQAEYDANPPAGAKPKKTRKPKAVRG